MKDFMPPESGTAGFLRSIASIERETHLLKSLALPASVARIFDETNRHTSYINRILPQFDNRQPTGFLAQIMSIARAGDQFLPSIATAFPAGSLYTHWARPGVSRATMFDKFSALGSLGSRFKTLQDLALPLHAHRHDIPWHQIIIRDYFDLAPALTRSLEQLSEAVDEVVAGHAYWEGSASVPDPIAQAAPSSALNSVNELFAQLFILISQRLLALARSPKVRPYVSLSPTDVKALVFTIIFFLFSAYQDSERDEAIRAMLEGLKGDQSSMLEELKQHGEVLQRLETKIDMLSTKDSVAYRIIEKEARLYNKPYGQKDTITIIQPGRIVKPLGYRSKYTKVFYLDFLSGADSTGWILKKKSRRCNISSIEFPLED